ncbi:unnamed protein product [Ilex paraguariensis]|uniref:GATA transcription factor 25 n=1 Tax=Ilex paraguariensis TaxID=185542 RepID=A0ABC8V142_9AQUA
MYGVTQPLNVPNHFSAAGEDDATTGGGGESIDNSHVGYEAHSFEDGGVGDLDGVEVAVPHEAVYAADGGDSDVQRGDVSNQLTLSFRGQVYVFDAVTMEKVQAVLLLLGGCEFSPGVPGGELAYQNQRGTMDYPTRCSDPQRAASLSKYRQKRKERCFDKKIRYNVRQEVALRMQRKKGQFTSAKKFEEFVGCSNPEDSGQDESPPETSCAHCGIGSKSTPMMRRGPAGPRTLCNACGLVWANRMKHCRGS